MISKQRQGNARLKRRVADLILVKLLLKDIASGNPQTRSGGLVWRAMPAMGMR